MCISAFTCFILRGLRAATLRSRMVREFSDFGFDGRPLLKRSRFKAPTTAMQPRSQCLTICEGLPSFVMIEANAVRCRLCSKM